MKADILPRGTRVYIEGHGEGAVAFTKRTRDGEHVMYVSVYLDEDGGKIPSVHKPELVMPVVGGPGSGYVDCSCRDCFEIAITSDGKPTLCHECKEAGCEPDSECSRPDAYGME